LPSREKSTIEILEHNGWTRQFIACEPRLSETVQLYQEAGFEVHLEPMPPVDGANEKMEPGSDDQCRRCYAGFENKYKIIFTRPKEGKDIE